MINKQKLRDAIAKKGMSYVFVSKKLEITTSGLNYKMNGVTPFKDYEIRTLANLCSLNAEEVEEIFLKGK